jgi:hypothetical protein
MTSWKTPTPEQVDSALALLGRAGQYRYFFDQLRNPLWLLPLKAKGIFTAPPKAIHNDKEGTVQHQPWAASRFLVRMSELPEAYDAVLDVALSIPETDDVLVHVDLLRIAANLPPAFAAQLARRAPDWIRSRALLTGDRAAAALITHLANGGEAASALELTKTLFEIFPSSRSHVGQSWARDVRTRLDRGMYDELIEKVSRPLVDAAGLDALRTFCSLLNAAIAASRSTEERDDVEDYSFAWRPAIDQQGQGGIDDVRHSLVNVIRDSALHLSSVGAVPNVRVLETLTSFRSHIFVRIALFLLRERPSLPAIEIILANRDNFDELGLRREYVLLLRDFFQRLSGSVQEQVISWIVGGPAIEGLDQADLRRWQLERLAPLSGMLPAGEQDLLDQLVREFGKPESLEVVQSHFAVWTGPGSPKTPDELAAMSDDDIILLLKEWKPVAQLMSDSTEGLGRTLTAAVVVSPERFATIAVRLREVQPTYVRAAIQGFHDAVRQGRPFQWELVLELSEWVLQQQHDYRKERRARPFESDPGWTWTRSAIASLLDTAVEQKGKPMPIGLRSTVWRLLVQLAEDDDPDAAHEAEYDGSSMDPPTLSLNTTRGRALHGVIRYALWVQRTRNDAGNFTFADIPEVKDLLERHLDTTIDPSLAIRSVYGQWFPWLVLLDRQWAANQAGRIFAGLDEGRQYWRAAWNTYLAFNPPYNNVVTVLRDQYIAAVEEIDHSLSESKEKEEAARRLAEHLVVLFGRGALDPGNLLETWFDRAPAWLRAAAISHIGWSMEQGGEIPADVVTRFQALWEQRRAKGEADPVAFKDELAAFGSWTVSSLFPIQWVLTELERVVRLVRDIDRDHSVMERLAKLAEAWPNETTRIAHLLVVCDAGWGASGWEVELGVILRAALASNNVEARQSAASIIDLLGRKGFLSFRELLNS